MAGARAAFGATWLLRRLQPDLAITAMGGREGLRIGFREGFFVAILLCSTGSLSGSWLAAGLVRP
ncbi:hypothetical protein CP49_28935 [Bradyrhizobium valentinum]|uniref:Uncharacterized protein n=1 Tax=Bradyrhizobium valentinum TaxID=1518501 RepID=A0A0R3KN48_9BRAD|nr:hypothetical protein CP49_28935 [Bradyrhizobium valentinum]